MPVLQTYVECLFKCFKDTYKSSITILDTAFKTVFDLNTKIAVQKQFFHIFFYINTFVEHNNDRCPVM